MTGELWPHQREAVDAAHGALKGGNPRGLWVMPTGTGKTRAFVTLAKEMTAAALVVVHRDELARQAVETFRLVWPEARVGTLPGRGWGDSRVVVATVQGLVRKLDKLPTGRFGLVVVDEAHHAPARSWVRVMEHFQPRFRLGCTATPERLDQLDIGDWFGEEPVYQYGLGQAMHDGYLVPLRQRGLFTKADLDSLPEGRGDFTKKQLAGAVASEPRTRAVVEGYQQHAAGRATLVFAVDLAHVRQVEAAFRAAGVAAASVTGGMKGEDRRRVLRQFAAGKHRVLVSCEVLTEGYDERSVSCVIMARPTKSRALYQQCVGRGLRIYPESGKQDCLVLDVIDRTSKHRVVVASELFGAPVRDCEGKDVREAATQERARWRLEPLSPSPALAARWEKGEETRWARLPTLVDYAPQRDWERKPASANQLKMLTRTYGFEANRRLTRGEASYLIDECNRLDRLYPTPATEGQKRMLRCRGLWRPGMSKRQATRLIAQQMAEAG